MTHRARQLLIEQRTRLTHSIRGHMAEVGIIARQGQAGFAALMVMIDRPEDTHLPAELRPILQVLLAQWRSLNPQIATLDQQILTWHNNNTDSRRLATIPQFGPILSSALVATAGQAKRFKSGRQFAAWIGLVPVQNSTGGKERLVGLQPTGARHPRTLAMVRPAARQNADEKSHRGACQQNGPHRLGVARQANHLPRAGAPTAISGRVTRSTLTAHHHQATEREGEGS